MRDAQINQPLPPTREIDPEQLLKTLEIQLLAQRRESGRGGGRMAFRVGSLVFIVLATLLALLVLQWMAAEMPRSQPKPAAETTAP